MSNHLLQQLWPRSYTGHQLDGGDGAHPSVLCGNGHTDAHRHTDTHRQRTLTQRTLTRLVTHAGSKEALPPAACHWRATSPNCSFFWVSRQKVPCTKLWGHSAGSLAHSHSWISLCPSGASALISEPHAWLVQVGVCW